MPLDNALSECNNRDMETTGTHTFSVTTGASTRSKSRQTRTWTITADSLDDACYEARKRHVALVGWNASIWISSSTELAWTPIPPITISPGDAPIAPTAAWRNPETGGIRYGPSHATFFDASGEWDGIEWEPVA